MRLRGEEMGIHYEYSAYSKFPTCSQLWLSQSLYAIQVNSPLLHEKKFMRSFAEEKRHQVTTSTTIDSIYHILSIINKHFTQPHITKIL